MPRTRFTKTVRKGERLQSANQDRRLDDLANELKVAKTDSISTAQPSTGGGKPCRRLEQKKRHKPVRFRASGTDQQ